jgi:hypothetical protein
MVQTLALAAVFFATAILLNFLKIIKTLLEIAQMILKPVFWVVGNTMSFIFSPCFGR